MDPSDGCVLGFLVETYHFTLDGSHISAGIAAGCISQLHKWVSLWKMNRFVNLSLFQSCCCRFLSDGEWAVKKGDLR